MSKPTLISLNRDIERLQKELVRLERRIEGLEKIILEEIIEPKRKAKKPPKLLP